MLNKTQALKIVKEYNPQNMEEGEVRAIIHQNRYVKHFIHFKMVDNEIIIVKIAYTKGNNSSSTTIYEA